MYFSLKDERATLRSAIYRGVGLRLRFEPRDGMQVLARGRITVYEPRGEYQFAIEEIQPQGVGALELALQQLKDKLNAKGYFDARRKKPLPRFPKSLALVTSSTGAAVRDMLELLARRWPVAAILVVPVRVQGDEAPGEIAAAVTMLNELQRVGHLQLDAMIVGRGGGSSEDLWAFNSELVVEAIYRSRIPVVSAVGHEIDVTLADFVADHRALTPSHAVTDLTPDRNELILGLLELQQRLLEALRRPVELGRQRWQTLAKHRIFRLPLAGLEERERRLDELAERLQRAGEQDSERRRQRVAQYAEQLHALSPLNILARGYSLTQWGTTIVRSASDVSVGDKVRTRLANGSIVSRVEAIEEEEA
jgi:exodeoxyribonuclease VII large subunit